MLISRSRDMRVKTAKALGLTLRFLPMRFQIGDRFTDETGDIDFVAAWVT